MTFPSNFRTSDIATSISIDASNIAQQAIEKARKDLTAVSQQLQKKGLEPDDLDFEVFFQPRKKVDEAFKEFQKTLREKYRDPQSEVISACVELAIRDVSVKIFTTSLEKELEDLMAEIVSRPQSGDQGKNDFPQRIKV